MITMKIPLWLRAFFDFILRRSHRRTVTPPPLPTPLLLSPPPPPPIEEPETEPEPVKISAPPSPIEEPEPEPEPVRISANRNERRRLERLRRKHDKFVQPKGPLPKPVTRTDKIKPKPRRSTVVVADEDDGKDEEILCADKHHEDRNGEDVLYKEAEFYGEFNFRDTILQQLERYFVYLARMKKHSPQSYALYRQIGATILPYVRTGADERGRDDDGDDEEQKSLPLWFHNTRPAFGCYAYGADPETEKYESAEHREGQGHNGCRSSCTTPSSAIRRRKSSR